MSAPLPGFTPDWPAPQNVRAWVTERGGPSRYGTLNLATHVGDDASAVAANRSGLRVALSLPTEPCWLEQVHGVRVLDLDRDDRGAADGAVTGSPGTVCAVLTADCLPVLLCDRAGRASAWRMPVGAGCSTACCRQRWRRSTLLPSSCWPGSGRRSVNRLRGRRRGPRRVRRAQLGCGAAICRECSRPLAGGPLGLARDALAATGIRAVYGGGFCTLTEAERFFSHRREAPCGRMATLIWLDLPTQSHVSSVAVEIPAIDPHVSPQPDDGSA